jgi:hypothetical protein
VVGRRRAGKGLAGEWHMVVVERVMRVGEWHMGMGRRLEEVGRKYTGEFLMDGCLVGEWHMGGRLMGEWLANLWCSGGCCMGVGYSLVGK